MKIKMAIDFSDEERKALSDYYDKKMSREELRLWVDGVVREILDGLLSE